MESLYGVPRTKCNSPHETSHVHHDDQWNSRIPLRIYVPCCLKGVGPFELGGKLGLVRWIAVATLDAPEFCDQTMAR